MLRFPFDEEKMKKRELLALKVFALLILLLLAACGRKEEPTLVPTVEIAPTDTAMPEELPPPAATDTTMPEQPPPVPDEVWARVEQAGKLVVGTSADYPPFEYYDDNFELDGFDIALIREMGDRLDLEVEISDMAFDGLGDALQLGQIDIAIAALSITDERREMVDFSNVYFVTEDAILATDEVQQVLVDPSDLAGSRVGVQTASVHEEWAQETLVDEGVIDEADLILYAQIDRSVDDLEEGLVDYVIADLPSAEVAVQGGGFAIVGQGLNRQRFGIALPKGAVVLQAQLNRALGELQAEGFIEELAEEYLDLDEEDLIPIPTPDPVLPKPTPAPTRAPVGCIDGMQWVADLSHDDNNMKNPPEMAPGQSFVKSWRVRNSGTCTWDSSYALVYAGGNTAAARMGGQPAAVDRQVKPGETYDFNVNLVSPLVPGVYQGFWTMRNAAGELFGTRMWVGIRVVGPATATPAPTATPSANIQFTVDRTNIKQGECVTFRWKVENVQAVYFYTDGQDWRHHGVAGEGTRTECPSKTTNYNLRVVFRDGNTEVRTIRINVEPASVGAPQIAQFAVNPERLQMGGCVSIQWDVQGEVTDVKISRDGTVLWQPAPVRGNVEDCPPGAGSFGYQLEAVGPGGTSRAQRNVTVEQPTAVPPTATPVQPTAPPPSTATPVPPTEPPPTPVPPTPGPDPPVINAFAVQPNQTKAGECVQVSWRTSGGTSLVQILRNGTIILDDGPLEGAEQDCLEAPGPYTYQLIASNSDGQSDSREASVTVSEAEPQNPLANTNWQLSSMYVNQVPAPETNIMAFFDANGSVGGNGSCNSYNGPYTVSGSNLSVGPFGRGMATCGEEIDSQEQLFLSAFESAASFELSGNQLVIRDSGGQEVLRFNRAG
jgi:polar amino acid transport system substrate-binding protein